MKKLLFILITLTSFGVFSQTGNLQGNIQDKEYAGNPLPFADVYIKGTTKGATTDFDGNYLIENIDTGIHTIVISFVGYQTKEVTGMHIKDGDTTIHNDELGADAAALKEVIVEGTTAVKESEKALIVQQKKATVVVESIGSEQLAKTGVTNAAAATTKIAGVTKSESSSQIYIRGLGDRYLTTTMNGLPIPSDNVDKKNIDLGLFNTNVIQNVGVSKTFTASNYSDQASGNIDIATKKYRKNFFKVNASYALNTNVFDSNFRATANNKNQTLGFFDSKINPSESISNNNWNPEFKTPVGNYSATLSGGYKFDLFGNALKATASLSHKSSNSAFEDGVFREYQNNAYARDFQDVDSYSTSVSTTGLLDLAYRLAVGQDLSFSGLFINSSTETLYEQGRSGLGRVRDQRDSNNDFGSFTRDQNFKQTQVLVGQIHGKHRLTENNKLNWAIGINGVSAKEPNRIRNVVNILTPTTDIEVLDDTGFDQRKSNQEIHDTEVNFTINDKITLVNLDADGKFKFNYGLDYRNKKRDFSSTFYGLSTTGNDVLTTPNLDQLSDILNTESITTDILSVNVQTEDIYEGELEVIAGFAEFYFGDEKISGSVGFRYEHDEINVDWDVAGFLGRIGGAKKVYDNYLPSVNLKYAINDQHFLRVASSITTTLPEFKEITPFIYVAPSGRGITGNEDLEKSDNYNFDIKYEFFPSNDQLISLSGFYKEIRNPINTTIEKGATGYITYDNTGERAKIFGLELEGKLNIIDKEAYKINTTFNATRMWHEQDLLKEFQYNEVTEVGLQGASDLILNGAVTFSTKSENEFISTISVNYQSDKIAILGASNNVITDPDSLLLNDEIIDKYLWTLDFVTSKVFFEKFKVTLTAQNLLDPLVNQRQRVHTNFSDNGGDDRLIRSYTNGRTFKVGLSYTF